MMNTDLNIVSCLPYNRRIRVKGAAATWPTVDDLEVRSDIRVSADKRSTLKSSLTPFITPSIIGEDVVLDLNLTGDQSETLSGGYYDIVVGDAGHIENRAIRVLGGKLTVKPLVTGV